MSGWSAWLISSMSIVLAWRVILRNDFAANCGADGVGALWGPWLFIAACPGVLFLKFAT
jgi:hypothetical protein